MNTFSKRKKPFLMMIATRREVQRYKYSITFSYDRCTIHFQNKGPCLKSPPTFFLHKRKTTQTIFILVVSHLHAPQTRTVDAPLHTLTSLSKLHTLFHHTSAIPNPYTLAHCSLLGIPILKFSNKK